MNGYPPLFLILIMYITEDTYITEDIYTRTYVHVVYLCIHMSASVYLHVYVHIHTTT